MDCLNQIHRWFRPYYHIAPLLSEWTERLGVDEVLDIASGGGEQIATILGYMKDQGVNTPRFVLSDLYPNLPAYGKLATRFDTKQIGYYKKPVAVGDLPEGQRALTIFTAFHHLPPKDATALLAEVVAHRDGIFIAEFTRRTWMDVLSMVPAFFFNLLAPVFAGRFSWSKLLLSPVIAAMVSFDGIVSAMRSYTPKEIEAMLPPGAEKDFVIEYGDVPWGRLSWARSSYFFLVRR